MKIKQYRRAHRPEKENVIFGLVIGAFSFTRDVFLVIMKVTSVGMLQYKKVDSPTLGIGVRRYLRVKGTPRHLYGEERECSPKRKRLLPLT